MLRTSFDGVIAANESFSAILFVVSIDGIAAGAVTFGLKVLILTTEESIFFFRRESVCAIILFLNVSGIALAGTFFLMILEVSALFLIVESFFICA